jgi:predicted nucleic acid-binding protein
MNIVIDTSAIIAVITNEPQRDKLINLTKGATLVAPSSVHWEIGNAFSAMYKRKRITLVQALQAVTIYRQIALQFVEIELEDALNIAAQFELYAYDAYLVCCAIQYRLPLLSLDRGLIHVAQQASIPVIKVDDL